MFSKRKVVALDDLKLVKKAQKERPVAEMLLRRLQPKIFQVIRATVRSSVEAEEIGQIVALEILKSLHNFRGEATLEAWAGGIAYRVSMKTLKKERQWDRVHAPIEEGFAVQTGTPEKSASKQQLYDVLLNQLEIIPTTRRTTLLLHLVHGYTVAEISEMLKVSPNTTKDRLKTALREMRSLMEQRPTLRQAMLEEIR